MKDPDQRESRKTEFKKGICNLGVHQLHLKKETFASLSFILSYIYLQLSMSVNLKKKELVYSQIKHIRVGYLSVKRYSLVYFCIKDKENS